MPPLQGWVANTQEPSGNEDVSIRFVIGPIMIFGWNACEDHYVYVPWPLNAVMSWRRSETLAQLSDMQQLLAKHELLSNAFDLLA